MSDPKILLYYVFAPVADPEAVRLWQHELCASLGLRGRIIVSRHGINGTLGGEIDACKQYLRRTRGYAPFAGLEAKWSDGSGYAETEPQLLRGADRSVPWRRSADFPRLSVKVRDELVAFGIPEETEVSGEGVVGGGAPLSPEAVHALVAERGDDVVFFDGRNAWEAEIGRFTGAVVPETSTTHDFVAQLESGAYDELKQRPVVTYCTGGIRCEILSAAMRKRGFAEVYQLDGGIVTYGEAYGNDGLWEGSLAVFDGRESIDFAPGAAVLGRCRACGAGSKRLADCPEPGCRARYAVCDAHASSACGAHPAAA
ncbi:rhodanese-related sulfurtransferase [Leucobacter allii]|uniref:oxygen-dependent tRNA uridine(34) hydroxylase TrhO n=1 Tax=Leucobacter allii TaxID=2932247 RepID=UPI001FD625E9|nr:rhodanese-related sulfurtransferase [Leucobacter allii]UOR01694.1 rhodanese-related sulfurtransferase [Leucobacter allii]